MMAHLDLAPIWSAPRRRPSRDEPSGNNEAERSLFERLQVALEFPADRRRAVATRDLRDNHQQKRRPLDDSQLELRNRLAYRAGLSPPPLGNKVRCLLLFLAGLKIMRADDSGAGARSRAATLIEPSDELIHSHELSALGAGELELETICIQSPGEMIKFTSSEFPQSGPGK